MEYFSRPKQQTRSHIVSEMHWPQVWAVTDANFLSQIGATFSIFPLNIFAIQNCLLSLFQVQQGWEVRKKSRDILLGFFGRTGTISIYKSGDIV